MSKRLQEIALAILDAPAQILETLLGTNWYPAINHVSGPELVTRRRAQSAIGDGELLLAGVRWPLSTATKNFAVLGLPESGKTVLQKLFTASVGERFRVPTRIERLIYFDAKNNQLPFLSQVLPGDVPIYAVSPLTGYAACDFAQTITTPALALRFASSLVPDTVKSTDDFWPKQSRLVIYAVILVLMAYADKDWTFADLVKILRDLSLTYAVLKLHPETAPQAEDLTGKLGKNIVASLRSFIGEMEIAAAGWEASPVRFSLEEIVFGRACLHLGFDPAVSVALRGIYSAMLDLLGDKLLERTGHDEKTWWILDELPQLPPVRSIRRLGLLGRESEAVVFAAMQEIVSLEIAWGEKEAREFLNMLQTVVCLRVGHETAKWFVDKVGDHFIAKNSFTQTYSKQNSWSVSTSYERMRLLTESDLTSLPHASAKDDCVRGYCFSPYAEPFQFDAPFMEGLSALPRPTLFSAPTRTASEQVLKRLTLEDVERLRLPLTDSLLEALRNPLGGP
jgi:hypothetical protein